MSDGISNCTAEESPKMTALDEIMSAVGRNNDTTRKLLDRLTECNNKLFGEESPSAPEAAKELIDEPGAVGMVKGELRTATKLLRQVDYQLSRTVKLV